MVQERKEKVVLGCGCFGGIGSAVEFFGVAGENEEEAWKIMTAAWNAGIRHFDTADAYGGGRSESYIGSWISHTNNQPIITSKTFNPMEEGEDKGLSKERINRQIKTTLERLKQPKINLYLAHEFDEENSLAETVEAFSILKNEQKVIEEFGVSNFSVEQLKEIISIQAPKSIQNSYSLLDRKAEKELFEICERNGIEFHAYSPLCGGWLTGKYKRNESNQLIKPDNSRMTLRPQPYLHLDREEVYNALDVLQSIADKYNTSMTAISIAWLLENKNVKKIIIGPRSVEQLQPVIDSFNVNLHHDDYLLLYNTFSFK